MNQQNISQAKVAFFDSGVGGLTVFEKVKKLLPNEDYIYFGDTKNVPYGKKSNAELLEFTTGIFKFFEQKGVKAVVMACNTTSATIYEDLTEKFDFKIYPIIQSSANEIAKLPVKKIGVFATEATIKSGVYGQEIKKYNPGIEVIEMTCPEWVGIVESNTKKKKENVDLIGRYVEKMLENKPDKIVLGCTHYPYLLDVLAKFAPKEIFVDPSLYFAKFIKDDLEKKDLLNKDIAGSEQFFVSANPENFMQASSMFYSLSNPPIFVNIS